MNVTKSVINGEKMHFLSRMILTFILLLFSFVSHTTDLAKEQRWAEQIVDTLFDGEPVILNDNGLEFLAIYTPSSANNTTDAAIIMHGLGVHPDWEQLIQPLRTALPEHGWSTLSLQMPILANGVGDEEYAPLFSEVAGRINAGISYLQQHGVKRIAIIAHSLGAAMATYYLSTHKPGQVAGFVGIGMSSSSTPVMDNVTSLKSVDVPVLDLYGENDLVDVVASAEARKQALESKNATLSKQKMVPGAGHFFDGKEQILIDEVTTWLNEF